MIAGVLAGLLQALGTQPVQRCLTANVLPGMYNLSSLAEPHAALFAMLQPQFLMRFYGCQATKSKCQYASHLLYTRGSLVVNSKTGWGNRLDYSAPPESARRGWKERQLLNHALQ